MSNEWKELDINNWPPDLLEYKKYEIETVGHMTTMGGEFALDIILQAVKDCENIRYRKIQPKAPTHQEIMTKWWKGYKDAWKKVDTYNSFPSAGKPIYIFNGEVSDGQMIGGDRCCVTKSWFIGKQSADIPPE